jgi:hypothetical protein
LDELALISQFKFLSIILSLHITICSLAILWFLLL